MELSPQICKANGTPNGYNTFVLPEFQHACDSIEYKKEIEEPRTKKILSSKGLLKLPCCNVLEKHIKNGKDSEYVLQEARKSFMSGHSSFSFYCATFLVIYLQVRLSNGQVQNSSSRKDDNIKARILLRYF